MLKVYIPNNSSQEIGGGFTFRKNFSKGVAGQAEVVGCWCEADVVLIAGATMADRKEIIDAQHGGKRIVLRVDNMPKDSRNRGTAVSRMRDFALMADYIVFQSEWAKNYVGWWIKNKVKAPAMGVIIESGKEEFERNSVVHNGVDAEHFYHEGDPSMRAENYLVVQYNRDENKRTTEAFHDFAMRARTRPEVRLKVVGKFSPDTVLYNFDLFGDEKVVYMGVVDDPGVMGDIMRSCRYFYFPAFADASSNALAEAIACGCEPLLVNDTGGSREVIERHKDRPHTIQEMAGEYIDIFEKLTKK